MIYTFDSKYTKYTVNYFVAEEYRSESHFPQSDCASIEWQIESVIQKEQALILLQSFKKDPK